MRYCHIVEDGMTCIVCFEREVNICLLPCKHERICSYCTVLLDDQLCPLCRKPVSQVEVVKSQELNLKTNRESKDDNVMKGNIKSSWCLSCIIESRKDEEEKIWDASNQVLLTGSFGLPLLEIQQFFIDKFNARQTEMSISTKNNSDRERSISIYPNGRKKQSFKIWNRLQSLWFSNRAVKASKYQTVLEEKPCDCKKFALEFRSFWGLTQRCETFKPNLELGGRKIRLFTKYYWEWLRILQGNERLLPQVVFLLFSEEFSNLYLNEALEMYDLMTTRYRNKFQRFPKIFFLYLKSAENQSNEKHDSQIQRIIYQHCNCSPHLVSLTIKRVSGKFHVVDSFDFEVALRSVS